MTLVTPALTPPVSNPTASGLLRRASPKWADTLDVAISATDTTLTLTGGTDLSTDSAVTLVLDPGTAKEEVILGFPEGSNIVNMYRHIEGATIGHDAGATVMMRNTAIDYNSIVDFLRLSLDPSTGLPITNTVSTAAIQALAVTAAKLAADAVTTAKILDDAVTPAKISKFPTMLTPKTASGQLVPSGTGTARTGLTWTFTAPFTGYADCSATLWGRPAVNTTTDNIAYWLKGGVTAADIATGSIRGISPGDNPGLLHTPSAVFAITEGVSYTLAVYVNASVATNYSSGSNDWGKITLYPTEFYLAA